MIIIDIKARRNNKNFVESQNVLSLRNDHFEGRALACIEEVQQWPSFDPNEKMNMLEIGDTFSGSLDKQDVRQLQSLFPNSSKRFTINQVKKFILDEMEKLKIEQPSPG